jgi:hypothetical protein
MILKIIYFQLRFYNKSLSYSSGRVSDAHEVIQLGFVLVARCRFVGLMPAAVVLFCSVHRYPGCDILQALFSPQRFILASRRWFIPLKMCITFWFHTNSYLDKHHQIIGYK